MLKNIMKLTILSQEHKNKISKSNFHFLTFFFVLLLGANIFCKQIPFNYKQNLIFIDVLINDTLNAKLILDNGADRNYLENSFI